MHFFPPNMVPPTLPQQPCSLFGISLVKSLLVFIPKLVLSCQAGHQGSGVVLWGWNAGEGVSLPLGGRQGAGTGLGKAPDELGTMQLCHVGQDAF